MLNSAVFSFHCFDRDCVTMYVTCYLRNQMYSQYPLQSLYVGTSMDRCELTVLEHLLLYRVHVDMWCNFLQFVIMFLDVNNSLSLVLWPLWTLQNWRPSTRHKLHFHGIVSIKKLYSVLLLFLTGYSKKEKFVFSLGWLCWPRLLQLRNIHIFAST